MEVLGKRNPIGNTFSFGIFLFWGQKGNIVNTPLGKRSRISLTVASGPVRSKDDTTRFGLVLRIKAILSIRKDCNIILVNGTAMAPWYVRTTEKEW